jgi:predicted Rossmann-fold nucleotide-binding protein
VLYGSAYWRELINFEALVRHGMISPEDLNLIHFADDPATALKVLTDSLNVAKDPVTPAFARSVTSCCDTTAESLTRS